MKFLAVHPGPLMYTKIYLRLEPLGLEMVAQAVRQAGHDVHLIDLQVETWKDYLAQLRTWKPDVVAFACNYLANVPEIVDLAKWTKRELPNCFVFVGGHSASFVAKDFLEHGDGAIDCVLKGEGEGAVPKLLLAVEHDRQAITKVPGVVTLDGEGPPPQFIASLDDIRPARDLLRHRRKYFIGVLDPCASIEFARGCPWDCSFCSAWTFYGRSYRMISPEKAVEELEQVQEPGIFIVDDVAFIQGEHGMAIGEAIARRGIKKQYYLETRGDVLLRNKEVFQFWKTLGLQYMFIGVEAIDEEGLRKHRKRISLGKNFEALEFARSLGITVAINIIADPDWDRSGSTSSGSGAWRFPRSSTSASTRRTRAPRPGSPNRASSTPRGTTASSTSSTPCCRRSCRCRSSTRSWSRPSRCSTEASGLGRARGSRRRLAAGTRCGADQLRQDAVEVQQRLQPEAPAGRPPTTGVV